MRTTRRATPMVIAAAITLGVVGLTGCSTSSPAALTPTEATTRTTPAPSTTAATNALEPGSIAVAGYEPSQVASAARFVERFARVAMAGCGADPLPIMEGLMSPTLYKFAVKTPQVVALSLKPPTVMSAGCLKSQTLSDGIVSAGEPVKGIPSVRVDVTVTQALMVGTTTSPTALTPITVRRHYRVDVLPSGTDWAAHKVGTSDSTVTSGK
jgi:hypothetical protein